MADMRKIGVLTSGGDSPGMNACIRAVVRTAVHHKVSVAGVLRGYEGLIKGDFQPLDSRSVGNIIHRGGTVLKTARSEAFRTEEGRRAAHDQYLAEELDGLVVIGGNGTFTGAKLFSEEFGVPVMGCPGTIDNDLYGTDLTIGFDTAVNTAISSIDRIRDTADSHDRLFFVEVMGRHSGCIALHAAIGCGAGTMLVPEVETSIEQLADILNRGAKRKKLFNVVIVAEGNPNGNAYQIAERVKERFTHSEIKVAVIGHLQRGGAPTALDRILASRLGYEAVEALLSGRTGEMVGLSNNEVVFVPFGTAIGRTKPLNPNLLRLSEVLSI